jgi:hypothetical protein
VQLDSAVNSQWAFCLIRYLMSKKWLLIAVAAAFGAGSSLGTLA